jgi:hypothetical protein
MTTFRIETASRWDAIALTQRLQGYHWYLIEPDAHHWDVHVALDEPAELPDDLRRRITEWLCERKLEAATVETDGRPEHLTTGGR